MEFYHIIFIILGILILLAATAFIIFSPRLFSTRRERYKIAYYQELDPSLNKLLKLFGPDILSVVPEKRIQVFNRTEGIDRLFQLSNNPWNISQTDFTLLRFILAIVGLLSGIVLAVVLSMLGSNLGILAAGLLVLMGYTYPTGYYKRIANEREAKFRSQMPEAVDYLVLALSSGTHSLDSAFVEAVSYLPDNLVKEEFNQIIRDLQSGRTIEGALNQFAKRAPIQEIKSFVRALNNANKQSVSTVTILKSYSKEARKSLENALEKKIAQLETKLSVALSIPSLIALILTILPPIVWVLLRAL